MDAAFFQRGILQLLAARDCGDAIKVGYWSWLPLKAIAAACRRWQPVAPGVTGHETELVIPQWHDFRLRVVLYRKHVNHETRRNFQLDLFTPDDGHYEYSAVATNLPLGLAALWAFACGRECGRREASRGPDAASAARPEGPGGPCSGTGARDGRSVDLPLVGGLHLGVQRDGPGRLRQADRVVAGAFVESEDTIRIVRTAPYEAVPLGPHNKPCKMLEIKRAK